MKNTIALFVTIIVSITNHVHAQVNAIEVGDPRARQMLQKQVEGAQHNKRGEAVYEGIRMMRIKESDADKSKYPTPPQYPDKIESLIKHGMTSHAANSISMDKNNLQISYLVPISIGEKTVYPIMIEGAYAYDDENHKRQFILVIYEQENKIISLFLLRDGHYILNDITFASIVKDHLQRQFIIPRKWAFGNQEINATIVRIENKNVVLDSEGGKEIVRAIAIFSKDDIEYMKTFVKLFPERNMQFKK